MILTICNIIKWFFVKSTNSSNTAKIDNKNWVGNNKYIPFERDELLLKFKQEIEDDKHYYHYERKRLSVDRSQILKDWLKTTQAIHKYPDLKNCITDEKLENITEKYNKYLFICKKLNETETVLSKEEFLIKEENPMYCVDWTNTLRFYQHLGFYEIHDKSTAKYFNSNTKELIEKEFELKWY